MNPIVRSKLASLAKAGVVGRKARQAQRNRELDAQRRKDTELDRSTRRRTTFQFDLWDKGSPPSTFYQCCGAGAAGSAIKLPPGAELRISAPGPDTYYFIKDVKKF
jgi:hypothetical protein